MSSEPPCLLQQIKPCWGEGRGYSGTAERMTRLVRVFDPSMAMAICIVQPLRKQARETGKNMDIRNMIEAGHFLCPLPPTYVKHLVLALLV